FPGYRDHADGCDAWGNLEYDLSQVLGLAWAATGSRLFLEALVPAARHYRDVDVIHHAPGHPQWVGLNHPHTALHFTFGKPAYVDLGHTWTEGLLTYYRLTGETRALEAARGIAPRLLPTPLAAARLPRRRARRSALREGRLDGREPAEDSRPGEAARHRGPDRLPAARAPRRRYTRPRRSSSAVGGRTATTV